MKRGESHFLFTGQNMRYEYLPLNYSAVFNAVLVTPFIERNAIYL